MPFWITLPAGGLVSALAGIAGGHPLSQAQRPVSCHGHHVFRGDGGVCADHLERLTGGERGMYMPEVTVFGSPAGYGRKNVLFPYLRYALS